MAETENASLASIELLSDLPAKALEDFSKRCSWRTSQINEQVIDRQSDSCDFCFIVKGRARVVNFSLSCCEVSFDEREGGAYFGELAAIDGEPRSANVVALEETVVASLSQEGSHDLLHNYPQVAVRILRTLAKIVRISTNRIMDLSTRVQTIACMHNCCGWLSRHEGRQYRRNFTHPHPRRYREPR